jgi:hypothetical protein
MARFALLVVFVIVVLMLLSGGNTPVESQPRWLQDLTLLLPSRHLVSFSQVIVYRWGGFGAVWRQFGGGDWRRVLRPQPGAFPQVDRRHQVGAAFMIQPFTSNCRLRSLWFMGQSIEASPHSMRSRPGDASPRAVLEPLWHTERSYGIRDARYATRQGARVT